MSSTKVAEYDDYDDSGAGFAGALLGFAFGGPIGAVLGGAIASGLSSSSSYRSSSYSYHSSYRSSYVDYEVQRRRELQRQEDERRRNEQRMLRERERQLRLEREQIEREREAERQRHIEEERQRRLEEERRRAIRNSWDRIQRELQRQIDSIKSSHERSQLVKLLNNTKQSYIQAMDNGNFSSAEDFINNLRQDITSKQNDEKLIASRQGELSRFLSELSGKAPAGFVEAINSLRNSDIKSSSSSIEAQDKRIKSLMSNAQRLASEISLANSISIDTLIEEKFIIPPVAVVDERAQKSIETTSLLQDIYDFGGRIAFFDEQEAEKLKPLIVEAKSDTGNSRLKLIRTQVKTTYNRLREQAILTDMFKRDINDFLPPMRKAKGTESLCVQMEDLLTASVISRDEYNEIYKAVKIVLSEQIKTIMDTFFAEKIGATLSEMGYNLIDENGNPADLPTDTMRMIDTPYEGYKVRVKVGHDNSVITRLVRVVGSEEEKASTSEYQHQQDIEICKKWRENITDFYRMLEDEGIKMNIVYSKEPGEEPLDVVVDKSFQRQRRTSTAKHQQEQLQEKRV